MSLRFPYLPRWLKKNQNPKPSNVLSLDSSTDSSQLHSDGLRPTRRLRNTRNKWDDKKIDKEYDIVLVPADGGCVSASESDDSDYSTGWLEPHGPGFLTDDYKDNSFAVLVKCYSRNQDSLLEGTKDNVFSTVVKMPDSYPPESKKYMEQLLGSLKNGSA